MCAACVYASIRYGPRRVRSAGTQPHPCDSHQCHREPSAKPVHRIVKQRNAITINSPVNLDAHRTNHARPPRRSPRGASLPRLPPSTIQKQLRRNPTQHVHITELLNIITKSSHHITRISTTRTTTRPNGIFSSNRAPASSGDEGAQQCQEAVRWLQERAEEEQDGIHYLQ